MQLKEHEDTNEVSKPIGNLKKEKGYSDGCHK